MKRGERIKNFRQMVIYIYNGALEFFFLFFCEIF